MSKSKAVGVFTCLALLGAVFGSLIGAEVVLAVEDDNGSAVLPLQKQQPPAGERLEFYTPYTILNDISGKSFRYEIELRYEGTETKTFNLSVTQLPRWTVSIRPIIKRIDITQIRLQPGKKPPYAVRVILEPIKGELPEPGEYLITLTASSGNVKASIELKAVVTDLYRFAFSTESGRLNADIAAGKENHIAASVKNTGTATIDKIAVVAGAPEYWVVKFKPEKIENLEPGSTQEVDIIVIPTKETIAGDYILDVGAISSRYGATFDLRATVLTPALWRWVGALVVLAVIAGVTVMYMRLRSR